MITTNLPRRPWKGKTFNSEVFSMGFHDPWKTILSFWARPYFQGRTVKNFRKNVTFTPFVVDGFRTPTVNSPVEGWGLRERLYWNPIMLRRLWDYIHPSKRCLSTGMSENHQRQGETPFPPPGFPHRSAPGPRSLGHQFATNKIQAKIYLLVLLMAEIPRPTTFWM